MIKLCICKLWIFIYQGGEDEEAPVAKTNNEVSMSVEETNKLREKLGLKPLDNKKTSTNEVHAPPKNMGKLFQLRSG